MLIMMLQDHSQTEELLSHVRSQLDSSIARHLDHSSRGKGGMERGRVVRS